MALQAIITAGGCVPRDLTGETTAQRKALLSIGGQTLLACALAAARGCEHLGEIAVVGNAEVQAAVPDGVAFVDEASTLIDNIHRAFEHLGGTAHDYLIISPDMPFITSAALSHFVNTATTNCEIGVPVITRECFLNAYPDAPNKFVRIAGSKQITMGSCFYLTGDALRSNIPLARDVIAMRKYPHRLAILLGLPILFALVFKRLRLEAVEERASTLTGVRFRALASEHAEIAYDIDNRENYDYAAQWAQSNPQ